MISVKHCLKNKTRKVFVPYILLVVALCVGINFPITSNVDPNKNVLASTESVNSSVKVNSNDDQPAIVLEKTEKFVVHDQPLYNNMLVGTDEDPHRPLTSDPGITFSFEYVDDGVMPYALYVPSTASTNPSTPLIIALHGLDQCGTGKGELKRSAIPSVLNNWSLEGFNAYVLLPHLTGVADFGAWNRPRARAALNKLLEEFVQERNVDAYRISIVGYSLGGYGSLYMASKDPDYYSACVSMSGYNAGIDLSEITAPTVGYVGTSSAGEDPRSYEYMSTKFKNAFGEDCLSVIKTSHGGVPKAAFTEDKNGDNKSDLIEWLLSQSR